MQPVWRQSESCFLFLVPVHVTFSSWFSVFLAVVFHLGFQNNTCLVVLFCSFLSVGRSVFISSFIFAAASCLDVVRFHKSPLLMTSGHRMSGMEREHLMQKKS